VRNEEIRRKTGLWKLELIIKERRLRWLGHVLRMEDSRIPHQATQWELRGTRESRDIQGKIGWDGHHQTRLEGHGHHLG